LGDTREKRLSSFTASIHIAEPNVLFERFTHRQLAVVALLLAQLPFVSSYNRLEGGQIERSDLFDHTADLRTQLVEKLLSKVGKAGRTSEHCRTGFWLAMHARRLSAYVRSIDPSSKAASITRIQ